MVAENAIRKSFCYNPVMPEVSSIEENNTMALTDEYKLPQELSAFIDDGFLVPLTPTPEEKTIAFDIPSMGYKDERDNDYSFTLIWIHPDFNKDFCHLYHEVPGDLPNFYVLKESRNTPEEHIDLDSLDDLLAWLEDRKERQ
jgi:hypothetical protein